MDYERLRLGVNLIDELVVDGVPVPSTLLIVGDPGSGKSTLCKQFIFHGLKHGGGAIYVALDESASEIEYTMKKFGWDIKSFQKEGTLIFLDYSLPNQLDINTLNIRLTEAFEAIKPLRKVRVVFDSLTALLGAARDLKPGLDFIRLLSSKIKGYGYTGLYTINRQGFDQKALALIKDMADGIIELKCEEERLLQSYLRISKMKGAVHSKMWVLYNVEVERGLTFYTPKVVLVGLPNSGKKTILSALGANGMEKNLFRVALDERNTIDFLVGETMEGDFARQIKSRDISATILVIDSADPGKFSAARKTLSQLTILNVPCYIIANKQDHPDAITIENLKDEFNVKDGIKIVGTIAKDKQSIEHAFRFILSDLLRFPV